MANRSQPNQFEPNRVRPNRASGLGAPQGCYDSSEAGSGYAMGRPRVHPAIIQRLIPKLGAEVPVGWALDIGCGAGLSTAALAPVAQRRLGLDPYRQMLSAHELVSPGADFVVATAEELPVADAAIDLVTAAGVVNYTDTDRLLPQIRRVLRPDGTLAIYDFGHGRTSPTAEGLTEWFASFQARYPSEPGYAMDVRELDFGSAGLVLFSYEQFDVAVRMEQREYVDYAMTGSGVLRELAAAASSAADRRARIEAWCNVTLLSVFAGQAVEVDFPAYLALVRVAPR